MKNHPQEMTSGKGCGPSVFQKWIPDGQFPDSLSVMEIFAVEGSATRPKRGSDNQGIVEPVMVTGLEIKCLLVESRVGHDGPKRQENGLQISFCVRGWEGSFSLSNEGVETFLDNLKADAGISRLNGSPDDLIGDGVLSFIACIQLIDE